MKIGVERGVERGLQSEVESGLGERRVENEEGGVEWS